MKRQYKARIRKKELHRMIECLKDIEENYYSELTTTDKEKLYLLNCNVSMLSEMICGREQQRIEESE